MYVCYGYPLSGNVYVCYGYPFYRYFYYFTILFWNCSNNVVFFLFFILFYFQFCVDGRNVNKAKRRFSLKLNDKNQVTYNKYRTEWIELGHACIIKTVYDSPLACSLGAPASMFFSQECHYPYSPYTRQLFVFRSKGEFVLKTLEVIFKDSTT